MLLFISRIIDSTVITPPAYNHSSLLVDFSCILFSEGLKITYKYILRQYLVGWGQGEFLPLALLQKRIEKNTFENRHTFHGKHSDNHLFLINSYIIMWL